MHKNLKNRSYVHRLLVCVCRSLQYTRIFSIVLFLAGINEPERHFQGGKIELPQGGIKTKKDSTIEKGRIGLL